MQATYFGLIAASHCLPPGTIPRNCGLRDPSSPTERHLRSISQRGVEENHRDFFNSVLFPAEQKLADDDTTHTVGKENDFLVIFEDVMVVEFATELIGEIHDRRGGTDLGVLNTRR